MYGILVSALSTVFGTLLRTVIVKFVVYSALFLLLTEFVPLALSPFMPSMDTLSSALGGMGSDFWFYADLVCLADGLKMVVGAAATAFVIRRLPVIG
jgi:hypothetical protein